ncbi:MAG: restriction endonuclease [Opitutaceae bacterium]|nr:restriction endonuclease [Opitutaceae bacterium]
MFGPVFFFIAGVGVAMLLLGLILLVWQRSQAAPAMEVRDAPIPTVSGPTADPFAQHWSQRLLEMLEWKRLEEVITAYIRLLGFEATTTGIGEDGVLHVAVAERGQAKPAMLIQCKAWNRGKVDDRAVQALHGAMTEAQAGQAAFFSTGGFTVAAVTYAKAHDIDLVNGSEFLDRLGQLPLNAQNELLDLATDGDYQTPTCPACGDKMVRRVIVKGEQSGVYFWGCRNYPGCTRTFPIG